MTQVTVEAAVRWQKALAGQDPLEITFHGGEPLVPGIEFYRMALPLLRQGFTPRQLRFGMQSNLWPRTDELCDLFHEDGVSLGTSLDGPKAINDAQRGTWVLPSHHGRHRTGARPRPLRRLHLHLHRALPTRAAEIFFLREGLNFSIHAAVPWLRSPGPDGWPLSPEAHGRLRLGNAHDCPSPDMLGRARSLLLSALERMGISSEQWLAAGLPLPDSSSTQVL